MSLSKHERDLLPPAAGRSDAGAGEGASRRAVAARLPRVACAILVVGVMLASWAGAGIPALAEAPAETPPTPAVPAVVEQRFTTADLDRSQALTVEEAIKGGYSTETFREIDRDRDRIVTLFEIGSFLAERAGRWQRADTNRDGQVSREEAEASPDMKGSFDKADRDADGIVRQQEYEAWSQTTLYQNVDLPVVVPNIINKRF